MAINKNKDIAEALEAAGFKNEAQVNHQAAETGQAVAGDLQAGLELGLEVAGTLTGASTISEVGGGETLGGEKLSGGERTVAILGVTPLGKIKKGGDVAASAAGAGGKKGAWGKFWDWVTGGGKKADAPSPSGSAKEIVDGRGVGGNKSTEVHATTRWRRQLYRRSRRSWWPYNSGEERWFQRRVYPRSDL